MESRLRFAARSIFATSRSPVSSILLCAFLAFCGALARAAVPIDGSNPQCDDYSVQVYTIFGNVEIYDASNEGWTWVHNSQPSKPIYREASGLVVASHVAAIDYPTTHDTHDHNTKILLDPGQEDILSNGNEPWPEDDEDSATRILEIEWEIGTLPGEKSGDGSAPMYRKSAWPSVGDRFWTDGHWIFDCGHTRDGKYPAEIHPPRATAAMRPTTYQLNGTGTTPVPVTLTDLYIHGRGGFVTEVLNCGMFETVLADVNCPVKTTPINKDFTFNVCLPVRPAPQAILTWLVFTGEGNNLNHQLRVEEVPATNICTNAGDEPLDTTTMLRVTAPLSSGAQPEDVYARTLIAGWVYPPDPPLRHVQVDLKSMNLHEDHEIEGFNGELTFFWMNLDKDPYPWRRLSDFDVPTDDDASIVCGSDHTNQLDDYDDDQLCGNGELRFNGPRYDFYVRNGRPYTLRTNGYDQDCYDSYFGDHGDFFEAAIVCKGGNPLELPNYGSGDKLGEVESSFGPDYSPAYGFGSRALELPTNNGDYELRVDISEIALTNEDTADVNVTMACSFSGEVLVVGKTLSCNVEGANRFGPGLPRGTTLDFSATPASATVKPANFTVRLPFNVGVNNETETAACGTPANGAISCAVGTVPAGGTAAVPLQIVPSVPGSLASRVDISTSSTDGDTSNNSAQFTTEAYRAVTLLIRPKEGGIKSVPTSGLFPVAVLTEPGFDATKIAFATVCFGAAAAPAQRDCTEAHARGHTTDVDQDRDLDMLLHYEAAQAGIKPGDAEACLIGRLTDGSGIYGCAALPPSK